MLQAIIISALLSAAPPEAHPWDVGATTPLIDPRLTEQRDTDTRYEMTPFDDRTDWEAFAKGLRQRILVSSGLWPPPDRSPLKARVFDTIDRGDYTVSKAHFEAYPGILVTGNLYMPKGDGPFPGVVCPHGHWGGGRLEDTERGSVPARGITFARMGIAAFTYDMVGYNDSRQFSFEWSHRPAEVPAAERERRQLWGIHPFAIQLWSGIRAVDFMQSLPQVDRERIGCTGASGGGTQTFALSAVDERIKVAAPVNMISHSMQGGCQCENAPLIRIGASNMEVGALFAPRPLLMVSATGDWTRETPTVEFPAIRGIYDLYDSANQISSVQVDAPHNYNLSSREAVYAHFRKWLLELPDDEVEHTEPPYEMEKVEDLRIFADDEPLEAERDSDALFDSLIAIQKDKWKRRLPNSAAGNENFSYGYRRALDDVVGLDPLRPLEVTAEQVNVVDGPGFRTEFHVLTVAPTKAVIPVVVFALAEPQDEAPVLIVHGEGKAALADAQGNPIGAARQWLSQGRTVVVADVFRTGEMQGERTRGSFPDTFLPTDTAYRIQDIIALIRWLKWRDPGYVPVNLVGLGEAGLWSLFAAALQPPGGEIHVDMNGFNPDDDAQWVARHYLPSVRSLGDVVTAAYILASRRLTIGGFAEDYEPFWFLKAYQDTGLQKNLTFLVGARKQ